MFDWLRRWFWFDSDDDDTMYHTSEDSWEEDRSFDDSTDMESDMITDPTYCFLESNIYHDLCDDHHDHHWDDSNSHDTTDDWNTTSDWDSWDDFSTSWDDDW